MARPLRIEFKHALYHVTSRGDGREAIYLSGEDRRVYMKVLKEVCEHFNWVLHAYRQMDNHYHLLFETPDGNLSKGMRQLNGVYTQRFNRAHRRVGHVFQGRYKAILVEKEAYLLELARYIVLNPVRAGMVRAAKDWPWSSYRATAGLSAQPACLSTDRLLSCFGGRKGVAIKKYREFVAQGKGQADVWSNLRRQIYLWSKAFVEEMQGKINLGASLDEVPLVQRRQSAQPLSQYESESDGRDQAIVKAYASGAYSMKVIGEYFGLHYSRVSRIIGRVREAKGKI